MATFTRIWECTLCKSKWDFMAILIGFDHKEYQSVYYANLNGFGLCYLITCGLSKDIQCHV